MQRDGQFGRRPRFARRGGARALAAALALAACAEAPVPYPLPDFRARAETQASGALSVSAAALGAAETEALFGVDLVDIDIQPVWIRVENREATGYFLFPISVDPDYYPPYEVARRAGLVSAEATRALYERIVEAHVPVYVGPEKAVEGFVFARTDEGMKAFSVELHDHDRTRRFAFVAPVPGVGRDFIDVEPERLAAPAEDLDDPGLRRWLEAAPAVASSPDGASGDPLNIAFVGSIDAVRSALVAVDWDAAAPIDSGSLRRVAGAFLFGGGYRYAPVSDLHLFGRRQDLAFQKARPTVVERNHLRLWLAPVRHQGRPVWLGQISRDVGVKLSGRVWPPTTHVIGPDVDAARFYLAQDLYRGDRLRRIGFVPGAPVAEPAAPAFNAEGDPYFSDGRRAVFFVEEQGRGAARVDFLPWTPFEALAHTWKDAPVAPAARPPQRVP